MPQHFWWLFAAYAVVWGAMFVFVGRLMARQAQLRREVDQFMRDGRG